MTLNIFLFTITIQKRETSFEELIQNEYARKIYEENKGKVTHYTRQW
ncbi:YrzI family small protein [Ornithinibacillus californiensis]|nr:YrzI family small protein [Ornithinibacillus californiensis]